MSKLSTTLNRAASRGVCSGRSVALPPQSTSTSIRSRQSSAASAGTTGTSVTGCTVSTGRRVNTAASSISGAAPTASSTPRPKLPYP